MIPVWAAEPLIKAGVSGLKYAFGGMQKFGDTAYAKRLKEIMRRGEMPLEARQSVLSDIARNTGTAAANAKAEMRGRLTASGMAGGLGEASQVASIDQGYTDRIADVSERLTAQNELTKSRARDEYAMRSAEYREGQNQQKNEFLGSLFGAAGQAALGGYKAHAIKKLTNDFQNGSADGKQMSEEEFLLGMKNLGIEDPWKYLQSLKGQ